MTGKIRVDRLHFDRSKGDFVLIVEGPDGGGKTRLAHWLSQALDWPIAPRVVAKDTTSEISLSGWVEDNIRRGPRKVIFDRHRLISEPIYGPLIRGDLTDGFDDMLWFSQHWRALMLMEPLVVFCLPPLGVVVGNVCEDPDNEVVREKIQLIYWQYWTLCARMMHPGEESRVNSVFLYDYTGTHHRTTPQEDREWLTRFAKNSKTRWPI